MGDRFPAVTAKQVVRAIQKIGFVYYRSGKGSHEFYIRERDRKIVMVSRRKTLGNILDAAGLTLEEFRELL